MKRIACIAFCMLLLLAALLCGCQQKEMATNAQIVLLKSEYQKQSSALNEIKAILEEKGYMNDPAYSLDIGKAADELNQIMRKLPSGGGNTSLEELEAYYALLDEIAAVMDEYRAKAEALEPLNASAPVAPAPAPDAEKREVTLGNMTFSYPAEINAEETRIDAEDKLTITILPPDEKIKIAASIGESPLTWALENGQEDMFLTVVRDAAYLPGMITNETEAATVAGAEAIHFAFNHEIAGARYITEMYMFTDGVNDYSFELTMTIGNYEQYKETFEAMLSSVTLDTP